MIILKKFMLILGFIVIMLGMPITGSADDAGMIKVGLMYGSSAPKTVTLSANGGFYYGYTEGTVFTKTGDITESTAEVSAPGGSQITVNSAQIAIGAAGITLYPNSGYISVNGSAYRGGIIIIPDANLNLTVINFLPTEQYLYGVISSEMPSSWNMEAQKAQAVCARNFAYTNMGKHASDGFNVCSTTNCQVYKGVAGETESSVSAADATAGKLLKYNGNIAETLFFSCSGGHTANVKNVWGSEIPYLCGVDDPYETDEAPLHTWTATLSNSDIKSVVSSLGANIGEITGLNVTTDESQHVYKLEIVGTGGTYTLKNQSTASAFSSYGVKSNKYTVTPYGGTSTGGIYALSSGGTTQLTPQFAISGNGTVAAVASSPEAVSSSGRAVLNTQTVGAQGYVFNGGGWGHGVGLSQYGAKGMADSGFTYDKILAHYYPGTYLE